jgi:hypothetical protein
MHKYVPPTRKEHEIQPDQMRKLNQAISQVKRSEPNEAIAYWIEPEDKFNFEDNPQT